MSIKLDQVYSIAPWVTLVSVGNDTLVVVKDPDITTIRGPKVRQILKPLLARIDGRITVSDLLEATASNNRVETLEYLSDFYRRGVLYPKEPRVSALEAFWGSGSSLTGLSGFSMGFGKSMHFNVGVYGKGECCDTVVAQLQESFVQCFLVEASDDLQLESAGLLVAMLDESDCDWAAIARLQWSGVPILVCVQLANRWIIGPVIVQGFGPTIRCVVDAATRFDSREGEYSSCRTRFPHILLLHLLGADLGLDHSMLVFQSDCTGPESLLVDASWYLDWDKGWIPRLHPCKDHVHLEIEGEPLGWEWVDSIALEMILQNSTGRDFDLNLPVCPTAGNLRSTVGLIIRRSVEYGCCNIYEYSGVGGKLKKIAECPSAGFTEIASNANLGFLIVSDISKLQEKYGDSLSETLAKYDIGVASACADLTATFYDVNLTHALMSKDFTDSISDLLGKKYRLSAYMLLPTRMTSLFGKRSNFGVDAIAIQQRRSTRAFSSFGLESTTLASLTEQARQLILEEPFPGELTLIRFNRVEKKVRAEIMELKHDRLQITAGLDLDAGSCGMMFRQEELAAAPLVFVFGVSLQQCCPASEERLAGLMYKFWLCATNLGLEGTMVGYLRKEIFSCFSNYIVDRLPVVLGPALVLGKTRKLSW